TELRVFLMARLHPHAWRGAQMRFVEEQVQIPTRLLKTPTPEKHISDVYVLSTETRTQNHWVNCVVTEKHGWLDATNRFIGDVTTITPDGGVLHQARARRSTGNFNTTP